MTQADEYKRGRELALGMLTRREQSQKELSFKLSKKDIPDDIAMQLISDLIENDWQSDDRFASMLSRTRSNRGFGPNRITMELRQHDINWDGQLENPVDWTENALERLNKHYKIAPQTQRERQKCRSYLNQRGFTSEQIRNALDEFCSR